MIVLMPQDTAATVISQATQQFSLVQRLNDPLLNSSPNSMAFKFLKANRFS